MKIAITMLLYVLIAVTCVSAQSGVDSESLCTPNSEPSGVSLYLEVPAFIETGLADGSMERVGGVIRNAQNQQSIAWLRQGGQMGNLAESGAGLLGDVLKLSGGGTMALGQFLASVTPILNISMAGFSLIEQIAGIRAHEAELERIYDRVAEEFQRDREVELLAALDFAENAFTASSKTFKHQAVVNVTYELTIARAQLLRDLDELLNAERTELHAKLAMNYQLLAMKVCTMSARLRLEIGEDMTALDGLSRCVVEHENYAKQFLRKWIGRTPAVYFHESVGDEYLDSYLGIEGWMLDQRDVLRQILMQSRDKFWDNSALSSIYTRAGLKDVLVEKPFYLYSLPNAEFLIENIQRLQGYELELESMCQSSFADWEALDGENGFSIREYDGYILLVDDEAVRGFTR